MDLQQRSLRIGAMAVAGAILLRLLGGGLLSSAAQFFTSPQAAAILLYLETGRLVRFPDNTAGKAPTETIPEQTQQSQKPGVMEPEPVLPGVVFTPSDAELVKVDSLCGYTVNTQQLLLQPLVWELAGQGPTVLILHTHGTESFENTEGYEESSDYRTLDTQYNMISVGDRLAELLEAQGISVIHDRKLHDNPSYSGSYQNARSQIEKYLEQYPTIRLVLDLHRDAVTDSSGEQMCFTVSSAGQKAAQLMLVMGSDAGGLVHPDWQDNMALAVKLQAQLEKICTGICRPISFRSQRFNQDLSSGALLIEVGAAGNTRQEALLSVEILTKAIVALSHGTAS